ELSPSRPHLLFKQTQTQTQGYNHRTHIQYKYELLTSASTVNNYRNKRSPLSTYHIIKAITRSSIGPSLDLHIQETKCCTEINNPTAIPLSILSSIYPTDDLSEPSKLIVFARAAVRMKLPCIVDPPRMLAT
ncbi:uncharacterized protein Bfra_008390, partial [Botrytis fragariae]